MVERAKEPRAWTRKPWRAFVADKTALLLMPAILATLLGYLGRLQPFFELFAHFRVFYALTSLLLAGLLLGLRSWRWAGTALGVAFLNLLPILPLYWPGPAAEGPANLRILSANVLTSNRGHGPLLHLIRRAKPDLIILEEVDPKWIDALQTIESNYPHSCKSPRSDNFGIAVYSRLPLADPRIVQLGNAQVPAITGTLTVAGRPVTLLALHTLPPGSASMVEERNLQLREAAEFCRACRTPVVVCGDLNTTPFAPSFRQFLAWSGLSDARRGFGIKPTWPTQYRPFMLPLDHCLVSPAIGVNAFLTGSHIGSDHLPILVDLVVPAAERPAATSRD